MPTGETFTLVQSINCQNHHEDEENCCNCMLLASPASPSRDVNDKYHLTLDEISCQGNVNETPLFIGTNSHRVKKSFASSSSLLTFATLATSYYGNNWTTQVLHFFQLPFRSIFGTFFHFFSFILSFSSSSPFFFFSSFSSTRKSPAPFKSLLLAVILFIFFISSSSAFENNLLNSTFLNPSSNSFSSSSSSSSPSSSSSSTHKSDSSEESSTETSFEHHPHPLINSSPTFDFAYLNKVHSFLYSTVESFFKSFTPLNQSTSSSSLDDINISSSKLTINTNEEEEEKKKRQKRGRESGKTNIAHSTHQIKLEDTIKIDSNDRENNLAKRSTLPRAHEEVTLFESNNLLFNPRHQHQYPNEHSSLLEEEKGGEVKDESQLMQNSPPDSQDFVEKITLGAIFPTTALITIKRSYYKKISDAVTSLISGRMNFSFPTKYFLAQAQVVLMPLSPSPNEILENVCNQLLVKNVTAVIYMTNSEIYSSNAASAQYLMQLINYYGIPMIAWNADNVGLEQRINDARILQLAPSIDHQALAILSLLKRYSWHIFSIVTTTMAGYNDFVRSLRDQTSAVDSIKYSILDVLTIRNTSDIEIRRQLSQLTTSESRVILLYAGRIDSRSILKTASSLGLTTASYMWIVTQSTVGTQLDHIAPAEFHPGMLGIFLNTTYLRLLDEIEKAVYIFGHGLDSFVNSMHQGQSSNSENSNNNNNINNIQSDFLRNKRIVINRNRASPSFRKNRPGNLGDRGDVFNNIPLNVSKVSLVPNINCNSSVRWPEGGLLFRHLRDISFRLKNHPDKIEFNPDNTLKHLQLDIVNLNNYGYWEKIGVWKEDGLDIKDITWPASSPVPPPGVPEMFHLKVTYLEEPSFVNLNDPDNETGECKVNRAVRCRFAPEAELIGINKSLAYRDPRYYRCCSGFCIDLLRKFASDLKFTFELNRVEDGTWGALNNGTWNGLVAELLNARADIVVTSIKINSERQAHVDFTVPFLETGITIVVAKKTGIISPKAFLEPFDTISWIMILLVSIQASAFAIFLFEWISPSGYDMMYLPQHGHKFSLFRTYWLVWAILFGAAVPVNCPRGYTSRLMANIWATFAVVFLAIYTANLAAFMITREDFHDFIGINDERLANPTTTKDGPLRFGTIPYGNTESVLKRNKPRMLQYMKQFNRSSSLEGVKAVKRGELDAFIYDAVVLDYLTGLDSDCRLLTVGQWYAMTGYGFALPKKSKYLAKFNGKMIEYRENGDLERLRKFWFQGACKPSKNKGKLSKPLDVNQFMSAFLLLGCGIILTVTLLALEHIYFKFCRKPLMALSATSKDGQADGCFTLISLSMATSLNLPDDDTCKRKTGQAIVGSSTSHPLAIFQPNRPSSRSDVEAGGEKKSHTMANTSSDNRQVTSYIPLSGLNSGIRVHKCNSLECSLTMLKLRHELRMARLQVKKLLKLQSEHQHQQQQYQQTTTTGTNNQFKPHFPSASSYQSSRVHESQQIVKVKSSKVRPNSSDPANGFAMSHPLSLVPSSSCNAIETLSPEELANASISCASVRRRKQQDSTGQQRRQLTHQSTVYSPSPAASDSSGYNVNSTAHSVLIHTSLPNSQSPSPTRHHSRSSSHQQLYPTSSGQGSFNLPPLSVPSTMQEAICPYEEMVRTQSGLELSNYCPDEEHLPCCTTASPGGRHTISVTCCDKANCTKPSIIHHHRRRPRSTGHGVAGSEHPFIPASRSSARQSDPCHVSITPPPIQSGRSSPVTSSHSIRPHSVATSQGFYSHREAIESVHSNLNVRTRVARLGQGSLSQIHQTSDQSAQITPDEREQIALDPLVSQRHHRSQQVASEAPSTSSTHTGSDSRYKCYLYHC